MSSQLNKALQQFFLHFAREIDKIEPFIFQVDECGTEAYRLFVQRRILLGENTLTGQQIYGYQEIPDQLIGFFKTYFLQRLVLEDTEMTDEGLYGILRVKGGPMESSQTLDDFMAILGRCNTKYGKLKEDHARTEQLLADCLKLLREQRQHHEYLQGIVRTWYRDRPVPEDCAVCWQPMSPSEFAITPCGHFLCSTCLAKCCPGCPVCRYGQVEDFIPLI
jgi:hypothetical protein